MVGQVQGKYGAKDKRIKRYLTVVEKEKSQFEHFDIQQVPRAKNEEADRLAKLASSDAEYIPPRVTMAHLPRPNIEVRRDLKVDTIGLEAM